jgi:NAD(P)H-dependent flavin oxidoreductase YrpB (nitropropane dioxygenase family)
MELTDRVAALEDRLDQFLPTLVTKADLKDFVPMLVTKADLKDFVPTLVTKADLQAVLPTLATKADLKADLQELRADVHEALHAQTWKLIGAALGASGLVVASLKLLH